MGAHNHATGLCGDGNRLSDAPRIGAIMLAGSRGRRPVVRWCAKRHPVRTARRRPRCHPAFTSHSGFSILGVAPSPPPPGMWHPPACAHTVVGGRPGRRRLARLRLRGRFTPRTERPPHRGRPGRGPRRDRGLATAPRICEFDRSPGTSRRRRRRLDRNANRFGRPDSRCVAKGTNPVLHMCCSWRCTCAQCNHRQAGPVCVARLGRSAGGPAPLRPSSRSRRTPSESGVGDRHVLDTRTRLRQVIDAGLRRYGPTLTFTSVRCA